MVSNVIQGYFPNGLPHAHGGAPAAPSHQAPALVSWVRDAIAVQPKMPQQQTRIAPVPTHPKPGAHVQCVQRLPNGSAVQLHANVPIRSSAGQPLPPDVRQRMEAAFGTSFGDVRVHVGSTAGTIGALAFTRGCDIHFAPGQYDPHTARGRHILAHELTHVVQQRTGRVRNPFSSGVAIVQDHALEGEAERMGLRIAQQQPQRDASIQRASSSSSSSSSSGGGGFTFGGKGGPGKGGDPPKWLGDKIKGADTASIRRMCNDDEFMAQLLAAMYVYTQARSIRSDTDENGHRVLDIALLRNSVFRPFIEYLSNSLVQAGDRGGHGNGEGIYPDGQYAEYGVLGGGMRLVVNLEDVSAYVSVHYARGTVYRLGGAGIEALMSRLVNARLG